jgi:hypothetical protein
MTGDYTQDVGGSIPSPPTTPARASGSDPAPPSKLLPWSPPTITDITESGAGHKPRRCRCMSIYGGLKKAKPAGPDSDGSLRKGTPSFSQADRA